MPFVNETMSAAIQTLAGGLGGLFGFSALGNIVDTLLKPIYEDTVLAWWNFRHRARYARRRLALQRDAGRRQQPGLLAVITARTAHRVLGHRSRFSHTVEFDAAAVPWIVGDNGCGHFFLGDRIGSTIKGAAGRSGVGRPGTGTHLHPRPLQHPGWKCVIGDRKDNEGRRRGCCGGFARSHQHCLNWAFCDSNIHH